MKQRLTAFVLAACIALPLPVMVVGSMMVQGCARAGNAVDDNAINYATSETTFVAALNAATRLGASGLLTKTQADRIEAIRVSGNRILDQWSLAVSRHEAASFQSSLDAILSELIQINAQAKQGGTR